MTFLGEQAGRKASWKRRYLVWALKARVNSDKYR